MYLSEAHIVFPAIFINERTGFFEEVDPVEVTGMHESVLKRGCGGGQELCDSAGRRFVVVDAQVLERLGPVWKWWLPSWLFRHAYSVDLKLSEVLPQTFEVILARLVEMEREQAWEMGLTPEHPDFIAHLDELRRCESIADLVALDRKRSGLPIESVAT